MYPYTQIHVNSLGMESFATFVSRTQTKEPSIAMSHTRDALIEGPAVPKVCVEQGRMALLHGFIKKTRKTPQRDIDLALKRKRGGGA